MRHAVVPGRCIQTQGWFVGIRRQRYLRRKKSVQGWPQEEREFYSAAASSACALPACDGVSASVLESLALGVPVVASENGRRGAGVVTLSGTNVADMVAKFRYVTKYYLEVKCGLPPETRDDNMAKMADWLLQNHRAGV